MRSSAERAHSQRPQDMDTVGLCMGDRDERGASEGLPLPTPAELDVGTQSAQEAAAQDEEEDLDDDSEFLSAVQHEDGCRAMCTMIMQRLDCPCHGHVSQVNSSH